MWPIHTWLVSLLDVALISCLTLEVWSLSVVKALRNIEPAHAHTILSTFKQCSDTIWLKKKCVYRLPVTYASVPCRCWQV